MNKSKKMVLIGLLLIIALIVPGLMFIQGQGEKEPGEQEVSDDENVEEEQIEEREEVKQNEESEENITEYTNTLTAKEIAEKKKPLEMVIDTGIVLGTEDEVAPLHNVLWTQFGDEKPEKGLHPTNEPEERLTDLSDEDVDRLKNYSIRGEDLGGYESFEEVDSDEAKLWIEKLAPNIPSFPGYEPAYVDFHTNEHLLYRMFNSKWAVRGVLQLQFVDNEHLFSEYMKENTLYEVDTEIVFSKVYNLDTKKSEFQLNEILYLSSLREVK